MATCGFSRRIRYHVATRVIPYGPFCLALTTRIEERQGRQNNLWGLQPGILNRTRQLCLQLLPGCLCEQCAGHDRRLSQCLKGVTTIAESNPKGGKCHSPLLFEDTVGPRTKASSSATNYHGIFPQPYSRSSSSALCKTVSLCRLHILEISRTYWTRLPRQIQRKPRDLCSRDWINQTILYPYH